MQSTQGRDQASAGVSIEGSLVSTRDHINLAFYGRPVTAKQLLVEGKYPSPVAAAALYSAMDDLLVRVGAPGTKRYCLSLPQSPTSQPGQVIDIARF